MVLSPSGTQTSCTAKHQTTSLCPQKQSLGLSLLADPSNHHEGELLSTTSARESSCPLLLYLLSLNPRIPAHSVSHLCTGCLVGIQLLSRCHFLILTTSWSTTSSSQCHEAQRTEHSISTFYWDWPLACSLKATYVCNSLTAGPPPKALLITKGLELEHSSRALA